MRFRSKPVGYYFYRKRTLAAILGFMGLMFLIELFHQSNDVIMFTSGGIGLAVFITILVAHFSIQKCEFGCGEWHPKRSRDMTALEFVRLYCHWGDQG